MGETLTFKPDGHEYWLGHKRLPSVTQVLKPAIDYSMVDPVVLERKRQIGIAVHMAIKLWLHGELDDASVVEPWAGYFRGWLKFWVDMGFKPEDVGMVECPLAHPTMGYAGTPDQVMLIGTQWSVIDAKNIVDMKPMWALQTAGYQELVQAQPGWAKKVKRRYSLRLREDGTYRLDEHTDRGDFGIFLSFLLTHRWMVANLRGWHEHAS